MATTKDLTTFAALLAQYGCRRVRREVGIDEIKPYDGRPNPRTATDQAVRNLAERIQATPQLLESRPTMVSNRTGKLLIIGGLRRWQACKLLGLKRIEVDEWTGLTENQEHEMMLLDNHLPGIGGEWDTAILSRDWQDTPISDWGVDTSALFADAADNPLGDIPDLPDDAKQAVEGEKAVRFTLTVHIDDSPEFEMSLDDMLGKFNRVKKTRKVVNVNGGFD
jgi:hypothetical protein